MPKENVSPRRCLYSWRSASPRAPSLFRALQTLRPSNAASENSMRSSNVVLARDAKVTIVQTEERASRKLQLSCVFPFCGTTTVSVTFHPWSKMLHLLGKEQGKLKKISDDLTSERAITKKEKTRKTWFCLKSGLKQRCVQSETFHPSLQTSYEASTRQQHGRSRHCCAVGCMYTVRRKKKIRKNGDTKNKIRKKKILSGGYLFIYPFGKICFNGNLPGG